MKPRGRVLILPPPRLPMKIIWGRMFLHVPGTVGSHDLCIGSHPTQLIVALSAMMTFMETKMNHTNHLSQPVDRRRSVTAKAVLLHAAAVMVNVFLTHWKTSSRGSIPHA